MFLRAAFVPPLRKSTCMSGVIASQSRPRLAASARAASVPSRVRLLNASQTASGMAGSLAIPVRSSSSTATPTRRRFAAICAW